MKKKYYKEINYYTLLQKLIREKYFNMFLGIFVSYIITINLIKIIPFPKKLNLNLPIFVSNKNTSVKSVAKKNVPKTYVVQEGDDLWQIAEKFYGSGFNAYDISMANKINANFIIKVGQKLIIPEVKRREPTVGDISSAATSQVTYIEGKYIVQPGDSLSLISQKVYGDLYAWPRILQANQLLSPDRIEVGMVLIIPR